MQKKKGQSNQGKISHGAALFINVSFNNKTKCKIASVILQKLKAKSPGKAISSYPNRQFRTSLITYFSDHLETREKSREIRPSFKMTPETHYQGNFQSIMVIWRRQRGRVVRAPDLKSVGADSNPVLTAS